MKRKILSLLLLVFMLSLMTACSSKNEENAAVNTFITPTAENGEISVDTDSLSEHPIFVNFDSNGTTIQLIAVKASDGSPRLSLNTCQACNPSPKAYFKEENGRLVCQNCGNIFTMDSVGSTSGGCNPMNIAYEISDDKMTVNTADLDAYANSFSLWSGPTE